MRPLAARSAHSTYADGVVAARLGLEESIPLLYLERLRLADDLPLALDRAWLPARLAAPLLGVDLTTTSLYEQLAASCGLHVTGGPRARPRVLAEPRRVPRARHLRRTTAVFTIERLERSGDEAVEWRTTVIRGDRFALTTRLDRPSPLSGEPVSQQRETAL